MAASKAVPVVSPSLLAAPGAAPTSAALYVHVPFCARLCPYCDFDTQDHDLHLIAPYAAALLQEIALTERATVHSIFLGGGTPSVLRPEQLARVLDACAARFDLLPGCEVTVECNPNQAREGRLAGYRAAGVNRLSFGVQAMDDATLVLLGRQHTATRVVQAVGAARAAGFEALSLDLMYGLPGQTLEGWEATLEAALALQPAHLSCYLLTLEDWTPMGRQVAEGVLRLPDDDLVASQYEQTRRRLAAVGLTQYEISNWARPGAESRHNLSYWRSEPYLGLGPGAVSCVAGRRQKRTPDVGAYLAGLREGRVIYAEDERLDATTEQREGLMLGLRLRGGIDAAAYQARFGIALEAVCGPALDELAEAGFLEWRGGHLRLTDRALLVSNEVLVRLGLP